ARKDTRTPVLVGVLGVLVYLVIALALIAPLGMLGLVLANSMQLTTHALVMLYLAHRHFDGLRGQDLPRSALKVLSASLAMGSAVLASYPHVTRLAERWPTWDELFVVVVGGAVGVASYAVLIWVLRVKEVAYLRDSIAARIRSASRTAAE
ncbi:MAG TPA: murein biosynthesis integral membrane protein MurJ, partial [Chloroflexi bacterium]|nr:murein biosynthesis integral membrane protein MurJ [Chloroflexota bacterium]